MPVDHFYVEHKNYFCSIKEVVCFGEGAGANILARFAVSTYAHQVQIQIPEGETLKRVGFSQKPEGQLTLGSGESESAKGQRWKTNIN